jgi:hypothetical protein
MRFFKLEPVRFSDGSVGHDLVSVPVDGIKIRIGAIGEESARAMLDALNTGSSWIECHVVNLHDLRKDGNG